jgi:hypothetical protein
MLEQPDFEVKGSLPEILSAKWFSPLKARVGVPTPRFALPVRVSKLPASEKSPQPAVIAGSRDDVPVSARDL